MTRLRLGDMLPSLWGRIEFLWATTHPFRLRWWVRGLGWLVFGLIAALIDPGDAWIGVLAFEFGVLAIGALRRRARLR